MSLHTSSAVETSSQGGRKFSLKLWWQIIRPHTLGAAVAPLLIAAGALVAEEKMRWSWYGVCFMVALLAQIASNLANDYFDYKTGLDTSARVGFDRALSRGLVSPRSMLIALVVTVALCVLLGLFLVFEAGWIALIIGLATVLGLLAYSAGPYPLARHGFGDLAVVVFFGLVPTLGTYYVVGDFPPLYLFFLALGIGMWEDNILVSNNYRDYDEDLGTGKSTIIVRSGRRMGPLLYSFNTVFSAAFILIGLYIEGSKWGCVGLLILFALCSSLGVYAICKMKGRQLNRLLKYTNKVSIVISIAVLLSLIID